MNPKGMLKGFVFLLCFAGVSLSLGREVDPAIRDALTEVFPASSSLKNLSPESRSSRDPQLVEARNGDALLGYGVSLYPVSRSGPFRIVVAVAPDETVVVVKIPKYPHRRGRKVRRKSFLEQFKGVSYGEPLSHQFGHRAHGWRSTSPASGAPPSEEREISMGRREKQHVEPDSETTS